MRRDITCCHVYSRHSLRTMPLSRTRSASFCSSWLGKQCPPCNWCLRAASRFSSHRYASRQAFTLIEVFAIVALLASLAVLAISNMDFSAKKWTVRPARPSLILAIGEAHNLARLHKEDMFLRYSEAESAIYIETMTGEDMFRIALTPGEINSMVFYRILPETERSESPKKEPEENPVTTMVFSPSGSATPMLIEIDAADGRHSLIFDPFSLKLIEDTSD